MYRGHIDWDQWCLEKIRLKLQQAESKLPGPITTRGSILVHGSVQVTFAINVPPSLVGDYCSRRVCSRFWQVPLYLRAFHFRQLMSRTPSCRWHLPSICRMLLFGLCSSGEMARRSMALPRQPPSLRAHRKNPMWRSFVKVVSSQYRDRALGHLGIARAMHRLPRLLCSLLPRIAV